MAALAAARGATVAVASKSESGGGATATRYEIALQNAVLERDTAKQEVDTAKASLVGVMANMGMDGEAIAKEVEDDPAKFEADSAPIKSALAAAVIRLREKEKDVRFLSVSMVDVMRMMQEQHEEMKQMMDAQRAETDALRGEMMQMMDAEREETKENVALLARWVWHNSGHDRYNYEIRQLHQRQQQQQHQRQHQQQS